MPVSAFTHITQGEIMTTKNPFEIRTELLGMAKEYLDQ